MSEQAEDTASESAEVERLVGTLVAGRYQVEELIGSGGMGAVFRATHVQLRKVVALKVLHLQMTILDEVVARFEREAIAAARVEHENVAAATDFGKLDDGSFFLVLEYIDGRSLTSLVETGPLAAPRALVITRQIAQALGAAHALGIVHRDLKPDNVMLIDKAGQTDFVKVLDFGIAKVTLEDQQNAPALTQLGTVFGTPQYMSPEQARGEAVDLRADLYAVGIMLYEMLTGSAPFDTEDLVALLTAQMLEAPPALPPQVDPEVSALVFRLLEKDPASRVQSAEELAQWCEHLLLRLDPTMLPSGPLSASPLSPPASAATMPASAATMPASAATMPASAATMPASAGAAGGANIATSPTVLNAPASSIADATGTVSAHTAAPSSVYAGLSTLGSELKNSIDVGGTRIPLWGIALGIAGSFAVVLVVVLVVVFSGPSDEEVASTVVSAPGVQVAPVDRGVAKLLGPAAAGDATALAELEKREPLSRSGVEWLALGKGRVIAGRVEAGLSAYQSAVAANPSLAKDRELLRHVRSAVEKADTRNAALDLAASGLGADGADILFDVWSSTKKTTKTTEKAKALLYDKKTLGAASPALRVALDLRRAKACHQYKALLPRATNTGDSRSLRPLKALRTSRGCGFLGLKDCFPCVRSGTALKDAIAAAEARPAPTFSPSAK